MALAVSPHALAITDLPQHNDETDDVPVRLSATVHSVLVPTDLDDPNGPNIDFSAVPIVGLMNRRGWRTEVMNNGRSWQWRKGSHDNRRSGYGGPFGGLSTERKAAYTRNKEIYHARRENARKAKAALQKAARTAARRATKDEQG